MITLEFVSKLRTDSVKEQFSSVLSEGMMDEKENGMVRIVRHNGRAVCLFNAYPKYTGAVLDLAFLPDTDDKRKLLAVITERVVRKYHPEQIVIENCRDDLTAVYEANSYRKNGKYYVKQTEPWRKVLGDRVFDDEGFIINQGLMKDIPFGWFDTQAKGCGWIAAWNIMKMNGKETRMEICAHDLEKHSPLGKMLGQNLFPLYAWLKKKGLNVHMSAPLNSAAADVIRKSKNGIILYNHARGAHYVSYRVLNRNEIQIYNAVYGKRNHVMKIEDFLKKFPLFPTAVAIGVY